MAQIPHFSAVHSKSLSLWLQNRAVWRTDRQTNGQTSRRWIVQGLHSRLCWRPVKVKHLQSICKMFYFTLNRGLRERYINGTSGCRKRIRQIFTGRQHKPCTSHRRDVRPSVRLSVTYAGTEWKRRKLSRNSKGFTPSEGVIWEWGRKNSQFSANKSPYLRNGAKLLLMTNRKSHTPFRLVPKSATLDDLERPIPLCCRKDASFWAHHKNLNEDRPILLAARIWANDSSFWWYKIYANIRGVSPGRGVQRQWGCRQRQFLAFSLAVFSL